MDLNPKHEHLDTVGSCCLSLCPPRFDRLGSKVKYLHFLFIWQISNKTGSEGKSIHKKHGEL